MLPINQTHSPSAYSAMWRFFSFMLLGLMAVSCQHDHLTPLTPPIVRSIPANQSWGSLPTSFKVDLGAKGIQEIPISALTPADQRRLTELLTRKPILVKQQSGSAQARFAGCGSSSELTWFIGRFCFTLDLTMYGGTISRHCMCLYVHELKVWNYTDCYDKANTGYLVIDLTEYLFKVCEEPGPAIYG